MTAARSCSAPTGQLKAKLASFREQVATIEFRRNGGGWECLPGPIAPELSDIESIYQAMMLGLRDYVNKTGFPSVMIGLSGGVDSALTAAVAADALGPERVHTLMMPSPYTSAIRWKTPRPAPKRSACATTSSASSRRWRRSAG